MKLDCNTPIHLNSRRSRRGPDRAHRKGAAVVEIAVTLPVILVIVLGSIQAASLMFLRQAMVQTAYESVKVAASHTGNSTKATEAGQRVAAGRRISNLEITFTPSNVESVPRGTPIRVRASAPGNANTVVPFGTLADRRIAAEAVMIKE